MRVLITGSKGFIGKHLSRELQESGWQVHGLDIHGRGPDLSQPGVFAEALGWIMPDRVVHLAAQVGRAFGEDDLIHTINSNATMTTLVAHACGEANVPVLYSSTSEAYGDRGSQVCSEGGPEALPHNLYGQSKRWGEEALRLYAPERLRIVRLSMPYGSGAPPGRGRRALDNMLWQAHHGKPIPVHRGAERSWCHASDLVRGIRMVMEQGDQELYNVGRDDRPISMLKLAEMCCDLAGASHDLIQVVEAPAGQTVVKRLSTERLRSLGWQPVVELEEGLPEVLEWVKGFEWTSS